MRPGPTLRIVAVNDVYLLDHLPRLKTLIASVRAASPSTPTLVTLAGDFVAPSLLSSIDQGVGMIDCLNDLGVDAVCFGNHEQDIAFGELLARVGEFRGAWLNANIPQLPVALPPAMVVTVPGPREVKVGLVGAVTEDPTLYRPDRFGGLEIAPLNAAVCEEAGRLVEAGCAAVVAMTHQSLARDRRLAAEHGGLPIPLILGGHEHEPHVEEIGPSWIVKAGTDAHYAAVIALEWSPDPPPAGARDLPKVAVRLEPVSAFDEEPALKARVQHHHRAVKALYATTLARIAEGQTLSSVGTRYQQTSVGTMVASRVRNATGADVCVINGGGIRGAKEYSGVFTCGDLETELPFANEVVVVEMPGAVLEEAIAASRSRAPVAAPGFLQVDDGVTVVDNRSLRRVAGQDFDAARVYRVATVRVLFDGMDGIDPLVNFARRPGVAIPPRDSGRELKVLVVEDVARALWRSLGRFDDLDLDGDGVLSVDELRQALAKAGEDPDNAVLVRGIVNALDVNRDGVVSRDEGS